LKTSWLLILVVALSVCAFGQLTPEAVVEQNAKLQKSITDLTTNNTETDKFTAALAGEQAILTEAHHTDLLNQGEVIKKAWTDKGGIGESKAAYLGEVARHGAACPDSTEDAALQASCEKWKANLDIILGGLQKRIKGWTTSKDALLADLKAYDDAPAHIRYYQYAIQNLERARTRILEALGQINNDVAACRDAIKGSSDEDMVEKCGQMWDGNAIHPGFVNKGTGTNSFGQGANPTPNNQQPQN
jgi:hypothetical protein